MKGRRARTIRKILTRMLVVVTLLSILLMCVVPAQAAKLSGVAYMYAGSAVQLGPELGGVPVENLQWASSDVSVATVISGNIQALMMGKTVIAASNGKRTAYLGLVVLPAQLNLKSGESISLPRAGGEKYYIEHSNIASVSKTGAVTGKQAGNTRIGIARGKQRYIIDLTVEGSTPDNIPQSPAAELDCADETDQIVLVDYTGGSSAQLSIHEKQNGIWTQLYSGKAYLGRNGIGKQKEGDGKTPTGTYNLTTPFGIKADPGANMPYTQVTKYHYWCGTSGSPYYNQLVDERVTQRKHTSSDEYLIDYKGVYNYCLFIDYNADGEESKGSCIFLHCKGSKSSTAGCVAVSESVMKSIIRWVRPGAKIVIR